MQSEFKLPPHIVSTSAQNLIGSEIIKLAGEIKDKIKQGERIYNLTIGDFDPKIFPIPTDLKKEIINAYQNNETNYPEANGVAELRTAVSTYLKDLGGLEYSAEQILISGGARPLIYATYLTLLDEGDTVVFPVPSWNNNHYTYLSKAKPIAVETRPENHFMPTASDLQPFLADATLLALCSPLNPTGTIFTKKDLEEICDLVLLENSKRKQGQKPLYLMYDQIYWALTFGHVEHYDPVSLRPEMRHYTIFIDGISKAFAATGVRVGWAFGPISIIDKMKAILSHIGAWSPKAEQVATANYLKNTDALNTYLDGFKDQIELRLNKFHDGFQKLKAKGLKLDSIVPQGAIYLTVKFDIQGQTQENGEKIESTKDVSKFLIDKVGLALVPFSAFGFSDNSSWYRLSVGTCKLEDIDEIMLSIERELKKLR